MPKFSCCVQLSWKSKLFRSLHWSCRFEQSPFKCLLLVFEITFLWIASLDCTERYFMHSLKTIAIWVLVCIQWAGSRILWLTDFLIFALSSRRCCMFLRLASSPVKFFTLVQSCQATKWASMSPLIIVLFVYNEQRAARTHANFRFWGAHAKSAHIWARLCNNQLELQKMCLCVYVCARPSKVNGHCCNFATADRSVANDPSRPMQITPLSAEWNYLNFASRRKSINNFGPTSIAIYRMQIEGNQTRLIIKKRSIKLIISLAFLSVGLHVFSLLMQLARKKSW